MCTVHILGNYFQVYLPLRHISKASRAQMRSIFLRLAKCRHDTLIQSKRKQQIAIFLQLYVTIRVTPALFFIRIEMRSYRGNIYCLKMVTICFQFHGRYFDFMFGVVNGSFYKYIFCNFLAQFFNRFISCFFSNFYFRLVN